MIPPRSILGIAFASASLLLTACMTGEPGPAARSDEPLRQCIGQAAYSQEAWDRLMMEPAVYAPACGEQLGPRTRTPEGVPAMLSHGSDRQPAPGESVRLHGFVMDAECGMVSEYRSTESLLPGPVSPIVIWDGRDAHGRPAPTGEYYVNMEIEWKDGSKDTTYQKVGYVQTSCP